MMTDVSLCSSSLIPMIINGNPFTDKTSSCCREMLPVVYFAPTYVASLCVGRFVLGSSSSSTSKGKAGWGNTRYKMYLTIGAF